MSTAKQIHVGSTRGKRLTFPWLRPLAEWFFCYPPLFLETAALLLIVLAVQWDPLGAKLIGLPGLFWHHAIWIQITAGFGVAAVLGEICLVGYLLDAEQNWMRRGRGGGDCAVPRTSWWYFFRTGTYPLLVIVAALPAAWAPSLRWGLPVGLVLGTVLVTALAWFGRSISPEKTGLFDWLLNLPKLWQRLPEEWQAELSSRRIILRLRPEERSELSDHYHLHAFQMFVSLALIAIYLTLYLIAEYWTAEFVSPALVICVLLALLTTTYGFIVFHFPLRHFGVLFLLVAGYLSLGSYVAQQYQFTGLDYAHPTSLSQVEAEAPPLRELPSNQQALDAWRGQFADGPLKLEGKPILVVISTKGGGARSAAWTTAVLTQLERDMPRLPYHTRLISGVSGGMLGATYYVATLNPPGSPTLHTIPGEKGESADTREIVDRISRDCLSPVVRHLALPLRGDRGEALERAWEQHTAGALARPLASLRDGERQGWRPSLVYAPMLVEDGRRLVISNLDLEFLVHNQGSLLDGHPRAASPTEGEYSRSGWQFASLFPTATSVRLSTVARMNASFPYISPDAELATSPPRRVVDAAYYDGYGVNLATLWIHYCRDWLRKHTAGVVLVQIRDRTRNFAAPSAMPGWRRALARFTTPIEGAIRARDATMSFRNDEMLHIVGEDLSRDPVTGAEDKEFFTTIIFEYPEKAPLSWYLPPEDLQRMKDEVARPDGTFAQQAQHLKDWWRRRETRSAR